MQITVSSAIAKRMDDSSSVMERVAGERGGAVAAKSRSDMRNAVSPNAKRRAIRCRCARPPLGAIIGARFPECRASPPEN